MHSLADEVEFCQAGVAETKEVSQTTFSKIHQKHCTKNLKVVTEQARVKRSTHTAWTARPKSSKQTLNFSVHCTEVTDCYVLCYTANAIH